MYSCSLGRFCPMWRLGVERCFSGWIQRVLWFLVLVASLRQELAWGCTANSEISVNKALLGCSAVASRCGVEWGSLGIHDVLPWREMKFGMLGASLVNKHQQNLVALPPLLSTASGHHGGGSWVAKLEAGAWGGNREARLRRKSTKDRFADVICGRWRPLRAAVYGRHRSFFFLLAVMPFRRIFGLSSTTHADGGPSGVVPGVVVGGRASRSAQSCFGGDEGPDRFFSVISKVFLVKSEGKVLDVVFVRVLFVNLPAA